MHACRLEKGTSVEAKHSGRIQMCPALLLLPAPPRQRGLTRSTTTVSAVPSSSVVLAHCRQRTLHAAAPWCASELVLVPAASGGHT